MPKVFLERQNSEMPSFSIPQAKDPAPYISRFLLIVCEIVGLPELSKSK